VNHRTASVVSIAVLKMMPSLLRARSLRVGMHMHTLWPNAVTRALSPIRRSCRAGASNAPQFHRREPSPSQADLCARSRRGRPLTRQPETPQTIACHRSVFRNVMKEGIDLVTASSPLDRRLARSGKLLRDAGEAAFAYHDEYIHAAKALPAPFPTKFALSFVACLERSGNRARLAARSTPERQYRGKVK
jgi:hypothetical protein